MDVVSYLHAVPARGMRTRRAAWEVYNAVPEVEVHEEQAVVGNQPGGREDLDVLLGPRAGVLPLRRPDPATHRRFARRLSVHSGGYREGIDPLLPTLSILAHRGFAARPGSCRRMASRGQNLRQLESRNACVRRRSVRRGWPRSACRW